MCSKSSQCKFKFVESNSSGQPWDCRSITCMLHGGPPPPMNNGAAGHTSVTVKFCPAKEVGEEVLCHIAEDSRFQDHLFKGLHCCSDYSCEVYTIYCVKLQNLTVSSLVTV